MSKNKTLSDAKNAKNDEFYTQYADIQKEVNAITKFKSEGRVVSANYGVIHGPMNILKYFCYAEGFFNPVPNDTNLEDTRMFRRYEAIKRQEEERSRKSWDIMGLFGK